MKCPNDDTLLVMTDRHGVEIDYCPTCRGVWLDRGELDKIIERNAPPAAPVAPVVMAEPGRDDRPRDDQRPREADRYREGDRPRDSDRSRDSDRPRDSDRYGDSRRDDDGRPYRKKREGFLSELFDF